MLKPKKARINHVDDVSSLLSPIYQNSSVQPINAHLFTCMFVKVDHIPSISISYTRLSRYTVLWTETSDKISFTYSILEMLEITCHYFSIGEKQTTNDIKGCRNFTKSRGTATILKKIIIFRRPTRKRIFLPEN